MKQKRTVTFAPTSARKAQPPPRAQPLLCAQPPPCAQPLTHDGTPPVSKVRDVRQIKKVEVVNRFDPEERTSPVPSNRAVVVKREKISTLANAIDKESRELPDHRSGARPVEPAKSESRKKTDFARCEPRRFLALPHLLLCQVRQTVVRQTAVKARKCLGPLAPLCLLPRPINTQMALLPLVTLATCQNRTLQR